MNDDVLNARKVKGAVTFSAWPIEAHGAADLKIVYLEEDTYDIPFETLIPPSGENLLVAGRCLSAEHEAVASARVTAQCFGMGYGVGAACALMLKEQIPSAATHRCGCRELDARSAFENSKGGIMLRSNFERGSTRWAVRRAQWIAMGIPEEDFMKPKIAVVNSSSTLSVCYIHLDEVSRTVQKAIRDAGGLPFEIRTAAPSDFVTSAGLKARYLMPTRDLMVNDIEVMVEGACLDGMVFCPPATKRLPRT